MQKLDCGQNGSNATVANINREAKRGSTQKLTTPSILHADLSIQSRDLVFVYPRIGQRGLMAPYTCASSLACASPLAVITDVVFLNFRRVFSEGELETFSFSIRVDARKSTPQFSLLGLFRRGSRHYPCLVGEWNVAKSLVAELVDTFPKSHPRFSAGAAFLLQCFLKCLILNLWRTRIAFLRVELFAKLFETDPFFPEFYVVPRC